MVSSRVPARKQDWDAEMVTMVSDSWRVSISLKFLVDESIKIISVFCNQQYTREYLKKIILFFEKLK